MAKFGLAFFRVVAGAVSLCAFGALALRSDPTRINSPDAFMFVNKNKNVSQQIDGSPAAPVSHSANDAATIEWSDRGPVLQQTAFSDILAQEPALSYFGMVEIKEDPLWRLEFGRTADRSTHVPDLTIREYGELGNKVAQRESTIAVVRDHLPNGTDTSPLVVYGPVEGVSDGAVTVLGQTFDASLLFSNGAEFEGLVGRLAYVEAQASENGFQATRVEFFGDYSVPGATTVFVHGNLAQSEDPLGHVSVGDLEVDVTGLYAEYSLEPGSQLSLPGIQPSPGGVILGYDELVADENLIAALATSDLVSISGSSLQSISGSSLQSISGSSLQSISGSSLQSISGSSLQSISGSSLQSISGSSLQSISGSSLQSISGSSLQSISGSSLQSISGSSLR
jgi:hypothetical protein